MIKPNPPSLDFNAFDLQGIRSLYVCALLHERGLLWWLVKVDCVAAEGQRVVDIGDLDQNRNLKIRTFLGLVLAPVFRELQPRLRYTEMGRRGITPMQYFQDFRNNPAPFGYGGFFEGRYEVRLCRSVSSEARGSDATPHNVERLILETRATLTGQPAVGAPLALGFAPVLGAPAIAGTGRVLHVPDPAKEPSRAPLGQRHPRRTPAVGGARLRRAISDDPAPAGAIESGFEEYACAMQELSGVWSIANSDVFQHIHAREYTIAMENGIGVALMAARLSLER